MKQRRISNSPLMDPSVCSLVVIAPAPQDVALVDPIRRDDHQRASGAVMKAAAIMDVPAFVLSRTAREQEVVPIDDLRGTSRLRQFVFDENGSPWSHRDFVNALTAEDRSILILSGFWLEHQILATALHALAESYDVCVLIDATPARCPHAVQPARDRLNQAGATPVVTSQVIHEWIIEAPDVAKQAALNSMLSDFMQVP